MASVMNICRYAVATLQRRETQRSYHRLAGNSIVVKMSMMRSIMILVRRRQAT